jgi:hypothetical protein
MGTAGAVAPITKLGYISPETCDDGDARKIMAEVLIGARTLDGPIDECSPPNMVWIPGGTFRMGSDRHYPEEAPAHKTLLDEFYRIAFRKKVYDTVEALQLDLDAWVTSYNEQRTHQGRWCFGKTPMQTFLDTIHVAREKQNPANAA